MSISRRRLLQAGAASGALLAMRPLGALAQPLGTTFGAGALRRSRLFEGTFVVHSDMHNHTMFSDGQADPEEGFADMRAGGLDVCAFTDHAVFGNQIGTVCGQTEVLTPDDTEDCSAVAGISEEKWARTTELAESANDPGAFVAIRGFEWSSTHLGLSTCGSPTAGSTRSPATA